MKKVRLGDVFEILNGYAFKSDKYVDSGIRVIRITNVQKGFIEDSDPKYYPLDTYKEIEKYILQSEDLLISLTGNVGRVALLDEKFLPAALNQRVGCLRLKNDKIGKSFAFHFLNSDNFENRCIVSANGIAQKNMSTEWLKDVEIPYYDEYEQKQIANILDKLTDLIDKRKKQLEKLDELIKSRFVEMFGDVENKCALSEICSIITDGTHQPPKFIHEGIPFLFVSNIVTNEINYNAAKFISEETYKDLYRRTPIEIGDIILSTVGSYGHPAIVKSSRKFLFQRHIAYLKPNSSIINPIYLHSAILSDDIQRQIDESVKGVAQKTLNLSEIKKILVAVPPIEIQNQFADFVEQIEKLKSEVKKGLEKLELLKNVLMQKYFG